MEYITAIKYNKRSAEYTIKRRNKETGEQSITTANRLNADETIFAKSCGEPFEDRYFVQWASR